MVFDTAEHLVPVVMAILRAESVWEIPVLGKLLASGAEKRMVAAQRETEEFIASSFGTWDADNDRADPADPAEHPEHPAAGDAADPGTSREDQSPVASGRPGPSA